MGKGDHPGEFEQVVMLAVARLGRDVPGGRVHDEIVERTGRDPSVPAVYVTLSRLEKKGLIASSVGPDPESGRALKRFSLTASGGEALEETRRQLDRLWAGLDLSRAVEAS